MLTLTPMKPNCTETFHYDMNDYLERYYDMPLSKTRAFEDNYVLNNMKVLRPKSTKISKSSSMKNQGELFATYTSSHIYTKDRLAQTSAKVSAFFTRNVDSSAQIGASSTYIELKKMAIPTTEITLSLDNKSNLINYGKTTANSDKTRKCTSSKIHYGRSSLPAINTSIKLKMKCERGFRTTQKSQTTCILPKM